MSKFARDFLEGALLFLADLFLFVLSAVVFDIFMITGCSLMDVEMNARVATGIFLVLTAVKFVFLKGGKNNG